VGPLHVFLLLFLCSSCSTTRPLVAEMDAQKIVFRHAETAFEVEFDTEKPSERAALTTFRTAIVNASSRADLQNAWTSIPALQARGADFLDARIFARAARDGDWPTGPPPNDEKTVYVDAVRQAIDSVLGQEQEDP
jgi:hypothetical protein